MYKSFLVLVILMILFGCAEGNDIFLDKFITLDEMPTSKSIKDLKFTDTIPTKDLKEVLLVDANAGYTPQFSKKGYYYIGKYKLNNDYYVIGFDSHARPMEETSQVIAIYDVRRKAITSKLIIGSKDYINRSSEYKNGIFTITAQYIYIPAGKECQPGQDNYSRNTTTEKYRINNDFVFEKAD